MNGNFTRVLKGILLHTDPRPSPTRKSAPECTKREAAAITAHHRKWFADFAEKQVMPLLNQVASSAKTHGFLTTCRLGEENGHLAADLVMYRGRLPNGARPPRLTIYATDGDRPLMVEYTGNFPRVGATGGFGAEVDFDPVYPSQLEEKILEFVALAVGA